jgi:hypothetical protein
MEITYTGNPLIHYPKTGILSNQPFSDALVLTVKTGPDATKVV